ncbi:MAG TPA: hypothetical protein EYP69_06035 [Bacteroidales bacterium]|nr:hypothetical protein [Bacteroidales bacterium]
MIYSFRFLLHQEKDFIAEIDAPDDSTFFDFHLSIQKFLKYDNRQMASFIITDKTWNKLKEIAMVNFEQENGESPMKTFKLSEILTKKGQRMLYVFDFFSERAFFVQLINIREGKIKTCKLKNMTGQIPDQTKIDLDFPDADNFDEEDDDFNNLDDFDDLQFDSDNF